MTDKDIDITNFSCLKLKIKNKIRMKYLISDAMLKCIFSLLFLSLYYLLY